MGSLLVVTASAQTFDVLHNFIEGGGKSRLTLSGDTLYGTSEHGGGEGSGIVYSVKTNGAGYVILHSFTNVVDGEGVLGGVALADGRLYGTTRSGGPGDDGNVFSMATDGTDFSMLRFFSGADPENGISPGPGVVVAGDKVYGTTPSGGEGNGIVFSIGTNGTGFQVLHSFSNDGAEGSEPAGRLVVADGRLYGTASHGGTNNSGVLFSLTITGTDFKLLHSFGPDNDDTGDGPVGLTLADGTLYGMTLNGGDGNDGMVFSIRTNGAGFKRLYSFTQGATNNGGGPSGDLTVSGYRLYGTTTRGGSSNDGTIFSLSTNGIDFRMMHSFSRDLFGNGVEPNCGVTLSGGAFYGITSDGGTDFGGTVFRFVAAPVPPVIQNPGLAGNSISLTWTSVVGETYRVQFNDDLASTNWLDLGSAIIATNSTMTTSDLIGTNAQRFYRVVLLQ
jgi:uncharacterized repeat protein (TIGR03803 family)